MIYSIIICILALLWMVAYLRRGAPTMGLPLAYLLALLLVHLPGPIIHTIAADSLTDSAFTEIGITLTAYGALAYSLGVLVARLKHPILPRHRPVDVPSFVIFCVVIGWMFILLTILIGSIPSLGALVSRGSSLWMLGVSLGLCAAYYRRKVFNYLAWLGVMALYPAMTLLSTGFLASATNAAIVVLAPVAILSRHYLRAIAWIIILTVTVLTLFLNYFINRDAIREAVWGGANLSERLVSIATVFQNFEMFDPGDPRHATSFDARLNQNYFVGMAAYRIHEGQMDYWHGQTLVDGVLALVPRALWPNKPISAGSGSIVRDATGLPLSETTSWGVGQVMEFYINFGMIGLLVGFFVLGWVLGKLDLRAAMAERRGKLGDLIVWYLPCVALIFPEGSMVDIIGAWGASLGIAVGLRYLWIELSRVGLKDVRGARWRAK
jgi:hypothetical protein